MPQCAIDGEADPSAHRTKNADENRSLASLMETLLIDHLKANGYLPSSGKPAGKRK